VFNLQSVIECNCFIASLLISDNEVPVSPIFDNPGEPPNSLAAAEVLDPNSAKPLGLTYVVQNPKFVTRPIRNDRTFISSSKFHDVAVVKSLHSSLLFSKCNL